MVNEKYVLLNSGPNGQGNFGDNGSVSEVEVKLGPYKTKVVRVSVAMLINFGCGGCEFCDLVGVLGCVIWCWVRLSGMDVISLLDLWFDSSSTKPIRKTMQQCIRRSSVGRVEEFCKWNWRLKGKCHRSPLS
ncbi:hypothetical protein Patl1_36441 [Pistacia atlantica]|nr:hypothetical protein Patl1_36441 [Pistacia atlantica]